MAKKLLLLFLILVILKVMLVSIIPAPTAFSDNYKFMKMSRSFFYSQEFSMHGEPMGKYQPLYPIAISPAYLFNDMELVYLFMKVINVVLSTLIILPVWLLAREFLGKRKSFYAALLSGIFPTFFLFPAFIMAENLFYTLFIFSLYFIYKSFTEDRKIWDILSGIFIGLTFLTRVAGLVLIGTVLAVFLFRHRQQFTKKIIMAMAFLVVVLPWLARNLLVFGYTINGLSGGNRYAEEAANTAYAQPYHFIIWILLYSGYLLLSSGIFPFCLNYFFLKMALVENKKRFFADAKLTLYAILFISVSALTLIVAANHNLSYIKYPNPLDLLGRPIGRYVDSIMPLILINGLIAFQYIKSNKFNKLLLLALPLLGFSAFLMFFPLFPVNNTSLVWAGLLNVLLKFIAYGKVIIDSSFVWVFLLSLLIFVSVPIIGYQLLKKRIKLFLPLLIVFFLLADIMGSAVIYYNSAMYWDNNEQLQLGKWFNRFDKKVSNVLFDERACTGMVVKGSDTVCEPGGITLAGIWMNDNIFIGSINNLENIDYIITKDTLLLPLVKETGSGTKIYSTR